MLCIRNLFHVIVFLTLSDAATAHEVSPALDDLATCMFQVLETTSGVHEPHLGYSMQHGWRHPYLEYRADEKASWNKPTRFDVLKPDSVERGPYEFSAALPGITTPGEKPDDHVTESVTRRWKGECGADVNYLFV